MPDVYETHFSHIVNIVYIQTRIEEDAPTNCTDSASVLSRLYPGLIDKPPSFTGLRFRFSSRLRFKRCIIWNDEIWDSPFKFRQSSEFGQQCCFIAADRRARAHRPTQFLTALPAFDCRTSCVQLLYQCDMSKSLENRSMLLCWALLQRMQLLYR